MGTGAGAPVKQAEDDEDRQDQYFFWACKMCRLRGKTVFLCRPQLCRRKKGPFCLLQLQEHPSRMASFAASRNLFIVSGGSWACSSPNGMLHAHSTGITLRSGWTLDHPEIASSTSFEFSQRLKTSPAPMHHQKIFAIQNPEWSACPSLQADDE